MKDTLGDRMKMYEGAEANRTLMPGLPIMIRLDGKAFHNFTQGLHRPYDERLSRLMAATTAYLVEQTNALIGYTQSDEISLVIYPVNALSETEFKGRVHKLDSINAARATLFFNKHLAEYIPEKANKDAIFDCRSWNVPTLIEASNCLLWRELDATRNSITMAAQHYYSHKQLQGKNSDQKQEMLFQKGVNWNDYPTFFKRGTYVHRITTEKKFSTQEIDNLPINHQARSNPDLMVSRSHVEFVTFPPLSTITNKVDVLFNWRNN